MEAVAEAENNLLGAQILNVIIYVIVMCICRGFKQIYGGKRYFRMGAYRLGFSNLH